MITGPSGIDANPDPFARHPELRDRIADPLTSYFRSFKVEDLVRELSVRGMRPDMIDPEDVREASRTVALRDRSGQDLWVFAYGSLMWDPALRFAEVRRAFAPEHERRFIFVDVSGWRGTPESPGVMAALDRGAGCEGLAFRIAADLVEEESHHLWRREKLGPVYTAAHIEIFIDGAPVSALTFLADYAADAIHPDLGYADQVRYAANGAGYYGSSFDYVENISRQFEALGIEDAHVSALLRDARACRDRQPE
ncbi:gamma-glutamylcyclotransferase [Sulfitobacter sp. D35]|uniref:gamma-glutamylcyclotransferase n=1 Tax=Sulfitobacter sp. D35 TaxID=3083252 RepID=UPI00296E9F27|nr:gamma-glutamylcyclotransferase [Sulfitobacter sp. D35]MDW4500117.1 gamma-glutamylcyclotransferase [Sulfitobacter sp. D35]